MGVHDRGAPFEDTVGEPRDVGPAERPAKVRDRILPDSPPVVHDETGLQPQLRRRTPRPRSSRRSTPIFASGKAPSSSSTRRAAAKASHERSASPRSRAGSSTGSAIRRPRSTLPGSRSARRRSGRRRHSDQRRRPERARRNPRPRSARDHRRPDLGHRRFRRQSLRPRSDGALLQLGALRASGAWDYPADTRGATPGIYHGSGDRLVSVRAGIALEAGDANLATMDWRIGKSHGLMAEYEARYSIGKLPGAWSLLLFHNTARHSRSGQPGGVRKQHRRDARRRSHQYGFAISMEQLTTASASFYG